MTLLKDNNYKDINVALLSLEADIKNKIAGFDTSEIDKQLAEINSRIDKINAGGGNNSSEEIEDINSKLNSNSNKIRNLEQNVEDIEQKLSDIFSAENKVTDFNTTTNSGVYYWVIDAANKPGNDYGVLLVNKYDGGNSATSLWINQVAYGANNKIYFRQNINSGNWTDWKAVAFEGELNADTVDNYHASQLWRSDGATWNPSANVVMTPSGNGSEWSFDFRDKNGATGSYWHVWDENKFTLLQVDADSGKVSAPYGFVGNLSGKASTAESADKATSDANGNNIVDTYATKTELEKPTTKTFNLNAVSGNTTKYIKLGTFYWNDNISFRCKLYGNTFEDVVNINILNGNTNGASVCGYYSTNAGRTKSIIVKRGGDWNKNIEIYLQVLQATNLNIDVTIDKDYQDRINISESTTAPTGTLEEIAFNNINGMFTNSIKVNNKLVIPIGAPSSLEDGCIWIER